MRLAALAIVLGACGKSTPIAVTSLASSPPVTAVPVRATAALRVMSYNVNFGIPGDPSSIEAIGGANAQIVMLQETNDAWAEALVHGLPRYPHHRFAPPDAWPAGGMGVMSMYPIISIDQLPSVAGPFFAWRVVVDAPGGPIQVLNVHLRPPMSDDGSWVVGYFSTREARERELAWHIAKLDTTIPTVIAGDFNEEGDGRAMAHADKLGYTDAIAQHAGATRTWEWPLGSITLRFQLDHVLFDERFTASAAGIVEGGRSDHKPIWADLERSAP